MSLVDFMQQLQDQDDSIIYSEELEPSIRVIPPDKICTKVIPPESEVIKPPTVIKLKINQQQLVLQNNDTSNTAAQSQIQNISNPIQTQPIAPVQEPIQNIVQPVTQPTQQVVVIKQDINEPIQQVVTQQPALIIEEPSENIITPICSEPEILSTEDTLFNKSGTELSRKAMWIEYYVKAKGSRKSNAIVDRMKLGRFTITPDNKVLLLPDYDVVGKDPDDILKDKWF